MKKKFTGRQRYEREKGHKLPNEDDFDDDEVFMVRIGAIREKKFSRRVAQNNACQELFRDLLPISPACKIRLF